MSFFIKKGNGGYEQEYHYRVRSSRRKGSIKGLDDLRHELMLYGWRNLEEQMLEAAVGVSGYAAWEAICRAFYRYAIKNPGVFSAMLWYNKYRDDETQKVTERLFSTCFQITAALGISKENCNHLIRTFRAFLEGFCLLANNIPLVMLYRLRTASTFPCRC